MPKPRAIHRAADASHRSNNVVRAACVRWVLFERTGAGLRGSPGDGLDYKLVLLDDLESAHLALIDT
jgi:hypothetical protein